MFATWQLRRDLLVPLNRERSRRRDNGCSVEQLKTYRGHSRDGLTLRLGPRLRSRQVLRLSFGIRLRSHLAPCLRRSSNRRRASRFRV